MNKFSKFPAEVVCELHPLFKGLLWVSAARSSDETRWALNHVCVEKTGLEWTLIATDGRRMHVHTFDAGLFDTDIEGLEPGLYEVVTKTSKLIVITRSEELELPAYPNWRGVFPEYEPTISDVMDARSISKMGVRTGVLLASDFASDALGFGCGVKGSDSVHVTYGSSSEGGAFVIRHELGKAIVMPLRLDEVPASTDSAPKTEAEATPDLKGFAEFFEMVKQAGGSMTIETSKGPVTISSDPPPAEKKTAKKKGKATAEV